MNLNLAVVSKLMFIDVKPHTIVNVVFKKNTHEKNPYRMTRIRYGLNADEIKLS